MVQLVRCLNLPAWRFALLVAAFGASFAGNFAHRTSRFSDLSSYRRWTWKLLLCTDDVYHCVILMSHLGFIVSICESTGVCHPREETRWKLLFYLLLISYHMVEITFGVNVNCLAEILLACWFCVVQHLFLELGCLAQLVGAVAYMQVLLGLCFLLFELQLGGC